MTTVITQTGQPTTWSAVNNIHTDDPSKGWILYDSKLYQVMYATDGTKMFVQYDNDELYDSRSISGGKPTKYTKLDEG